MILNGSIQEPLFSSKTFSSPQKTAAAAAKSLQSCPTLCDPEDGSPPGSPSLGFSRQEHWSGLPFPPPMHESENEVSQSCLTLSNPMDCSLPGSSIHGIFHARVLEWAAIAFSPQKTIQCLLSSNSPFPPSPSVLDNHQSAFSMGYLTCIFHIKRIV